MPDKAYCVLILIFFTASKANSRVCFKQGLSHYPLSITVKFLLTGIMNNWQPCLPWLIQQPPFRVLIPFRRREWSSHPYNTILLKVPLLWLFNQTWKRVKSKTMRTLKAPRFFQMSFLLRILPIPLHKHSFLIRNCSKGELVQQSRDRGYQGYDHRNI